MAQYDQIQAKNYNDIRKSLNTLLGSGSGEYGYGQILASFDVREGMEIDKAHFDYLKLDIDRCLRHQTGLDSTLVQLPAVIVGKEIVWSTIVAYQLLVDQVITDKDTFYTGATSGGYTAQMETINGGSRTLASGWGNNAAGQRYGEQLYYVTWSKANAARYFFNTGGLLKITAFADGAATNTKSVGWRNVATRLNDLPFTFGMDEYRQGIAGTQTEFSVTVNDTTNPYYTNYAFARFTLINSKTIQVLVQYVDNDIGSHDPATDHGDPAYWGVGVDETVTVDLHAGLEYRRAIESMNIEVPTFTVGDFVIPYDQVARVYSTKGAHTLIVPPGVKTIRVIMAGGGGGGSAGYYGYDAGESLVTRPGAGGGGGETFDQYMTVVPLETLYINVGGGGNGGSASSTASSSPTNGQDSSIVSHSGTTLIARGGKAAAGPTGGFSGSGNSGGAAGGGGGGSGSNATGVNGGDGLSYSTPSGSVSIGGGGAGGIGVGGLGGLGGGAATGNSAIDSGGGGGGALTPSGYSSAGGAGGVGTVIVIA